MSEEERRQEGYYQIDFTTEEARDEAYSTLMALNKKGLMRNLRRRTIYVIDIQEN